MPLTLRKDFVEPDTPVRDALDFMEEKGISAVPVVRKGRVLGVFSYEGALRGFVSPKGKVADYTHKAKSVIYQPSLSGAVALFTLTKSRAIVVRDLYGRFRGFMTREDIVRELRAEVSLQSLIETRFTTIESRDTVIKSRIEMIEKKKTELPVVDSGEFKGLITAESIVEKLFSSCETTETLLRINYSLVRDLDQKDVYLNVGSSASDATNLFASGLAEIPVLNEGKIVGVASVFKLLSSSLQISLDTGNTVRFLSYSLQDELADEIRSFIRDILPRFNSLKSNLTDLKLERVMGKKYSLRAVVKTKAGRLDVSETGIDPRALVLETFRKLEGLLKGSQEEVSENKKD